jgi:hypothetical protein
MLHGVAHTDGPPPAHQRQRNLNMTRNVGGIDRMLRITVGLALIAAAATGTLGPWAYVGVVPLLTGLLGWCPPYALMGFNTCAMKK